MKLSHFKKTMEAEITGFVEDWIENNVKAPCEWPFEMEEKEWRESFLHWIRIREDSPER